MSSKIVTDSALRVLGSRSVLRQGMSAQRAADVIYALVASESVYLRLSEQGWGNSAYASVLEQMLTGALTA